MWSEIDLPRPRLRERLHGPALEAAERASDHTRGFLLFAGRNDTESGAVPLTCREIGGEGGPGQNDGRDNDEAPTGHVRIVRTGPALLPFSGQQRAAVADGRPLVFGFRRLGQRRHEDVAERLEVAVEIGVRAVLTQKRLRDERQVAVRFDEEGPHDRDGPGIPEQRRPVLD